MLPIATIVYFSFGYKPGIFGTHAEDILSFDRYVEAIDPPESKLKMTADAAEISALRLLDAAARARAE